MKTLIIRVFRVIRGSKFLSKLNQLRRATGSVTHRFLIPQDHQSDSVGFPSEGHFNREGA